MSLSVTHNNSPSTTPHGRDKQALHAAVQTQSWHARAVDCSVDRAVCATPQQAPPCCAALPGLLSTGASGGGPGDGCSSGATRKATTLPRGLPRRLNVG
ncbi:MAG: hypothetical protein WDW38_006244 [Sanguina aurantia]